MMDALLDMFMRLDVPWVVALALVGNWAVFFAALGIGHALVRHFHMKPTSPTPEPITRAELLYATSCVLVNAAVTIAGIVLWQRGVVQVGRAVSGWAILDALILFFAMDFLMYIFHRIAHLPWVFPLVHATHHRYNNPRPLTLFVLNPFETAAFGVLWISVITIFTASWLGIGLYLTVNLAFGLLGHLGVEPFPARWIALPGVRDVSTSTFHAEHHRDEQHNFGFYTLLWDRIFGTLAPAYARDFLASQGMDDTQSEVTEAETVA